MYKVIITGATGFVGSHLMKYLGSLGYEVDTISTQEFMNEDWRRLDNFKLELSSPNPHDEKEYGERPDIVVHCAWPKKDLHTTEQLEFAEMSCNFFNECKKRGIRVINLGSSSEYGVKYEPMREDMICEPINTYGIAKLMVTLYAKKLGFNTLRLFSVYGRGGAWDANKPHDKRAVMNIKRHMVNVGIVCMAIERLIHAEHLHGEIINVADPLTYEYDYSIFYDADANPGTYPQAQYEPSMWCADLTKMKRLINL